MMSTLKGQTAIITGGGTGIGEGITLALAEAGVNVVVCGRRVEPLQGVVEQVQAKGAQGLAAQADVSVVEDVQGVVEAALKTFGQVNILINNAGISGGGFIHRHNIEAWDKIIAINLRGPFLFARSVLPLMRKQKSGHIINISSESGLEYYKGNGAYGVSKHALNALSEFIQQENQEYGIRVNTICPGMVITGMTENIKGLNHKKRMQPEDMADLVMWLLTRRANIKIGLPILIQTMENPWV